MDFKFIFHVFPKELLHVAMWQKLPNAKGQGAKIEVCFTFFQDFFLLMALHDVIFNVTAMI
jgi:hypothetical protein